MSSLSDLFGQAGQNPLLDITSWVTSSPQTRRRIAAEELADLVAVEAKIKKSTVELKTMVTARGSIPSGLTTERPQGTSQMR